MSGPRLAVAVPGADAAEVVAAARAAEEWSLDAIVVGDVAGTAANADDSYVLTTGAAVAMATTYLRIAVVLDLRSSAPLLRVAEDLGVLDAMSAGRIELLLRPGDDPGWRRDLEAVLGAWRAWPLPDGSTVAITPAPVQPALPAWLIEGSAAADLRGGAGVLFADWPAAIPDAAALLELRRARDAAGAATVVMDAGTVAPAQRAEVIRAMGTVVAPCLRCPEDEVGILALDSTEYLQRTDLHAPPEPDQ